MFCTKKRKSDFPQDDQGRAILGTAKEMATWVKLGFEEQDKRKSSDDPLFRHYIDLTKCVLYISYPIGSKTPATIIFISRKVKAIRRDIKKLK